jgi:hypothetical protein
MCKILSISIAIFLLCVMLNQYAAASDQLPDEFQRAAQTIIDRSQTHAYAPTLPDDQRLGGLSLTSAQSALLRRFGILQEAYRADPTATHDLLRRILDAGELQ